MTTRTGVLRTLFSDAYPKMSGPNNAQLALFGIGFAFLSLTLATFALLLYGLSSMPGDHRHGAAHLRSHFRPVSLDLSAVAQTYLESTAPQTRAKNPNCSYWDCFNVYKCGHGNADRMSVYVYPLQTFVDATTKKAATTLSKEFYQILQAIVDSPYYTPYPDEACVLVPSIDLLNQNHVDGGLVAKALDTLDHWNNGENHILFNMLPGVAPDFNTSLDVASDQAIVAGSGFDTWTYRPGFDISIPFLNPLLPAGPSQSTTAHHERPFLFISGQLNMYGRHNRILQELAYDHADVLVLQSCADPSMRRGGGDDDDDESNKKREPDTAADVERSQMQHLDRRCSFPGGQTFEYPDVLDKGVFCLVARGTRLVQLNLLEVMAAKCIPVIMADNVVMPFNEIIDWTLAAVTIRETSLHAIRTTLSTISPERIVELRTQGAWLHSQYFHSLKQIVRTTLDQLNDRIFPHLARDYRHWNIPVTQTATQNPLFLQLTAPKAPGFTAVILTYDRVESLFTLVEKLSVVPSLQKILVIWNNQKKAPPHNSMFPKIAKPLNVIRTKSNKLSNRFYPYADIETEAILTIDDDIVMLTADELDFGYEVWREFPDRIVGFPSRTHVWDNATGRWRYESEWTNEISMVLTGAAFHHKYWSHMYTNAMPGNIKDWVDEHMNCEDIAMNFLVANVTGKPPIKVAPRKKFKCPECTNTEMLSADLNHMLERTDCINRFAAIYGRMPLRSVEFRADPVLYKDNFPEKLKRFNDIGSL